MGSVFWASFYSKKDPKDEILLNDEVLPCKNIIFAYKEKSQKIQWKIWLILFLAIAPFLFA